MKRFLAGVLAFVMTLSLVMPSVPVWARNVEGIELENDYASGTNSGEYIYTMYSNNSIKLIGFTGNSSAALVIPSTIDGYTVVALGENFLDDRYSTVSITIPSTVTVIDEGAFETNNLEEIIVESGNTAFKVVDGALLSADEAYVNDLYGMYFGRAADDTGKADWLSKLSAGATRDAIIPGFINSQEFANLLATFGL